MKRLHFAILGAMIAALPLAAVAQIAVGRDAAQLNLRAVYESRPDLINLFAADFTATERARAMGFETLEEWAKRYGQREYPELLGWYRPSGGTASCAFTTAGGTGPAKLGDDEFRASAVTSPAYLVVDVASKKVLASRNADQTRSIASLTKLMTAMVALDRRVPMDARIVMQKGDEVGGARLRVPVGTSVAARDIMYAMLVGSANNSANALARATGIAREKFVAAMNEKAASLGCAATTFKDASGMNPENVSTAQEIAALTLKALSYNEIRRMTSTQLYDVRTSGGPHRIKNTNGLLTNNANGLYVTGGKTGFLDEAGWNLVVRMHDGEHPPLLVVVMGSSSQTQSFRDAEALARWSWRNYAW